MEDGRRMGDQISSQWVIKEVTYFDHATHRFVVGDIEIADEQIVAIKTPGTSTYARAWDGRAYVCTPGLVRAHADSHTIADASEPLSRAGITTAGTLCATASECIAAASRTRLPRLRLITRLVLNPVTRARSQQRRPDARARAPELRVFERIEALVRRNAGRLALAVHCPSIVSAYELAYAQDVAAALRLDLGFVLSDDEPSARAFRDRFYSSETHLLDFMQLLRPGTTIWGCSQLTRGDIETLAASGAHVIGSGAASLSSLFSLSERRAQRGSRALAQPHSTGASSATRFAALLGIPDSYANADNFVDAATVAAAAALGERTCGRIAPGMRADLCLFSSPGRDLLGSGSEALVQLFECDKPEVVVVAGTTKSRPAAGNRAKSSARPERSGERACTPQAPAASSINIALL